MKGTRKSRTVGQKRQGFKRGPVEIHGEMELLRLLDRFLDRALCFATGL